MSGPGGQSTYSPRVRKKRLRAREEILQEAEEILDAGGVERVTLAAVAEKLGITKPALYHYFPSKEALARSLVTRLLDTEIDALCKAVDAVAPGEPVLGTMIRAFHHFYSNRMNAFRAVYCQTQLFSGSAIPMDEDTLRNEVHPKTRRLFDLLERRLEEEPRDGRAAQDPRQLAFSAWLGALGLMTMKSIADAMKDPLRHGDEELLATLTRTFDDAAGH